MTATIPNMPALMQSIAVCQTHREALQDALTDLKGRKIGLDDLNRLDKADRRLLDQFAYRYTRLQDDMGARLIPNILRALSEEITAMPTVDRLSRMEQLGWLESAEEWSELRQVRNEFTHDYPDDAHERLARLQLAMVCGERISQIYERFVLKLRQRGITC
uniref:Nucleotidyltransferase substrate binding protein, HI0074 family n=1 Tax=Candidatus Kentrum sp. LPFa TaxID=2126335 RepID=A0A450W2D5_9GAMM|nr:MAG: hypothetical protein BECKLPF1236B_GA0070989_102127 [Candidatus Kentron sp. LPFa]